MSHKEYLHIVHDLLSRAQSKVQIEDHEIFFKMGDKSDYWLLSTKIFSSKRSLPSDLQQAFRNVRFLYLNRKDVYLATNDETGEVFFFKKLPNLDRFILFRRHLLEYVEEMKDWKVALENL